MSSFDEDTGKSFHKFEPDSYRGNKYEAFCDFVDQYHYEYDAIAKNPPENLRQMRIS